MRKNTEAEALKHALAALDDGSGHEVWGPGPVGFKLIEQGHLVAAAAFDKAAVLAVELGHTKRPLMIRTMRRLAPILLELAQGDGA